MSDTLDLLEPVSEKARDDAENLKASRVDFYNLYATEKLGMPDGWQWYSLEALGQYPNYTGSLVRGLVPATFERGKRKGLPDFKRGDKATELSFALTRQQLRDFQAEWEQREGKCSHCFGTGQEWIGWSKAEGSRFKPCGQCGATGKPKDGAA